MARENSGPGGLSVIYGPYEKDNPTASCVRVAGERYQVVVDFDYAHLPDAGKLKQVIPPQSAILDARLHVITAFAGGMSYDIGLVQTDGTEGTGDADGLFENLLLASINVAGNVVAGNGALLPKNLSSSGVAVPAITTYVKTGANPLQVKVAATGSFSAGKARLVIEYAKQV